MSHGRASGGTECRCTAGRALVVPSVEHTTGAARLRSRRRIDGSLVPALGVIGPAELPNNQSVRTVTGEFGAWAQ